MLEEPAEKLDGIKGGGWWTSPSGLTVGEGDGTVLESHETPVGEGEPEDLRSKVLAGGVSMGPRLPVDIPGDMPDLRVDVLQPSGSAHVFFAEGSVDGREGFDGDQEVGSGGEPAGAVL